MAGITVSEGENEAMNCYLDMRGKVGLSARGFIFPSENETSKVEESLTNENYDTIIPGVVHMHKKVPYPVSVAGGTIRVSSRKLEIGMQYPIIFENKKYVVVKPHEGAIDLYELSD